MKNGVKLFMGLCVLTVNGASSQEEFLMKNFDNLDIVSTSLQHHRITYYAFPKEGALYGCSHAHCEGRLFDSYNKYVQHQAAIEKKDSERK